MAVAFVQGNSHSPASFSFTATVTLPSNTAGNLLVVGIEAGFSEKTSISDTAGNVWQTGNIQDHASSSDWRLRLYYAENCKASAGTNTITVTDSAGLLALIDVAEYSGVATSLSYSNGTQAGLVGSTSAFSVTAGDLIVALSFALGGGMSAGTGMTARETSGSKLMLADGIASGSSFTASINGSGEQSILAVAFHASPAPNEGLYQGGDITRSNGTAGVYSESAPFVSNPAGNTLIAFLQLPDLTTLGTASITDTAGNTWSLIDNATSGFSAWAVSSCNASSGANVVTASFTLTSTAGIRLWIAQYANSPVTSHAVSSSNSVTVPSTSGALVVAGTLCASPGIDPGAGYSGRKTDEGLQIEDGTSTGSTATATSSGGGTPRTMIALSIGSPALAQPFVWVVF